jgi:uncharacterized protein YwgA
MDNNLLLLKLFLDKLEQPPIIDSVNDRKRLQKAVYLGQVLGTDLGYRFSWYLMGPYSTGLTRDYYQLNQDINTSSDQSSEYELAAHLRADLETAKQHMRKPEGWKRTETDWLELLASWHYLLNVSQYTEEQAEKELARSKPTLAQHVKFARDRLSQIG